MRVMFRTIIFSPVKHFCSFLSIVDVLNAIAVVQNLVFDIFDCVRLFVESKTLSYPYQNATGRTISTLQYKHQLEDIKRFSRHIPFSVSSHTTGYHGAFRV
jgi:hypothetical protein